ncbi:hypothetical protein HYFRA_00008754 [Hymenoscyphus fraxineus]|uniref:LYR motif-containing protein Cup1-like N-terminal domain-containing protein n=1 Tax=Hymenoscyphus fraxineus TaxID=746836 RepID=A0A9N9L2M4_9HELO|nr:hypothetical protein HYFRA_00008754 [Hymenoscyphus fraxineus]
MATVRRALENVTISFAPIEKIEPSSRRLKTLTAYRSLLRAITYTPDPVAREYCYETARARFRTKAGKSKTEDDDKRLAERLRKAHSSARRLHRANRGVVEDLISVLDRAYGKAGPRRRLLIRDLLEPDEDDLPQDNAALSTLMLGSPTAVPNFDHHLNMTKKFEAFLQSQVVRPSTEQRGKASFKDAKPKLPQKNLWGRPMPHKRAVKMVKRWWADALEKIHPPVPHHIWDRLRDLSTGEIPTPEFIPRRSSPEQPEKLLVMNDQLVINNLRNPAREKGELEWRADQRKIYVAPPIKESDEKTAETAYNSPRTLRRIYADIWAKTAKVYKDLDTKEWVIEWGYGKSQLFQDPVASLYDSQLELFEGTDSGIASSTQPKANEKTKAERRLTVWNPRTPFWSPPPPKPDPPVKQDDKSAEEKKGVSEESIMRLALRQRELIKNKKKGRGIMRTLPTRKELGGGKP